MCNFMMNKNLNNYSVSEEEHCSKQGSYYPCAAVDFFHLSGEHLDGDVGDEAECDAVGNVVGERHHCDGEERRKSDRRICPLDLLDAAYHEDADIDERCGICTCGDECNDGREEHCNEEQCCGDHCRKTGSAAGCNAGGGFNEGGDGGSTANRTNAGCDCVCEHCLVHVGDFVLALFVLDEQITATASAVESAHGIEHIDHAERKCGGDESDNKAAGAVALDGEVLGEVKTLGENLEERAVCKVFECCKGVHAYAVKEAVVELGNGEAEGKICDGACENADEDSALDILFGENANADYGCNGDEHRHDAGPCCRAEKIEGSKSNTGGSVLCNDACILEAEERNEQADTGRDGDLNSRGNGIENELAETGCGEKNEDQAVSQNEEQSVRVGKAEAKANGVHEECVQTHTGSLRQRQVCHEAYEESADDCADCRCNVNCIVGNAGKCREHSGVDHEDVGHCHKGGNACYYLGANSSSTLRKLEHFLHFLAPFSFIFCFSKAKKPRVLSSKTPGAFPYEPTLAQNYLLCQRPRFKFV